MKMIYALALAALLLPAAAHAQEDAAGAKPMKEIAAPAPARALTVAVLPFSASKGGGEAAELGDDLYQLLGAYMSAADGIMMVERAEVDKALSEVELGKSGTVDPETAAKVGHLVGAQVLVTGRIIPVQRDLTIVAKIIGVETGRTFGETAEMPVRGSIKEAALELSQKVSATIAGKGETLVAKVEDKQDIIARLRPLVEGRKELPSVSVVIDAMNMNRTDTDTSAQTEIAWVLENLGFTVIDVMATNTKAGIEVTGSAISEFAMRKGNLVSAKACVEIKAVRQADGKVVLIDREPTVAVDLSPEAAGKEAQARAAAVLAERLVRAIVDLR